MKKQFLFAVLLLNSFYFVPIAVSAQSWSRADLASQLLLQNLGLDKNPDPETTHMETLNSMAGFEVVQVSLNHSELGTTRLLLKGPQGFLQQGTALPALIIVSGFFTGEQSIHLVGETKDRILVGFEYPYQLADFQKDPATILQFLRKTPGQLALALRWLQTQSWIQPQNLSIAGVSLGGIFLPAGLHLSQILGVNLKQTIFICTGADIPTILQANLSTLFSENILQPLISALALPTLLLDPRLHLPSLKGPFLIIQTDQDTVIPKSAQDSLQNLLPTPKQQITLPGPHINPDQKDLISKIQSLLTTPRP